MAAYVGIEIGGTKLQLALGDGSAKIQERLKFAVDSRAGADGIRRQIETSLPQLFQGRSIAGIGVGFGGPVDWRTGQICRSHQVSGWSDFDMAGWLRRLIDAPVVVENDANAGALGEATCGAGTGFDPVFYVTLGSGVGGGLVVNGRIYHGAKPGEAEIGHIRLDRTGTIVESRCSGWAVDARIRDLKVSEPSGALARMASGTEKGEAKHLAAAVAQGDASAIRILRETAEDLAFGLSHVVHLFHPQVIVLGGGLSCVGEPLRAAVKSALSRFVMDAFAPGPAVTLAALGEDAVPVGALVLAKARQSELP